MFILENDLLKIGIKKTGAELCKITSVKNNTEFMWDANPAVWGSYAPNLFPIIGALKDNTYMFEGKSYSLPKHGIIRNNPAIEWHEETKNSITLKLVYSDATLKVYPFKFEFYITYTLNNANLEIKHTVLNKDTKTLFFSLGGHPAFKCPVFENEVYEDYSLEFEQPETSKTHVINMENGVISDKTKPVLDNSDCLPLTHHLFNEDALIFKDLKSRRITLKSKTHGGILSVSYPDFNYLGIWAKPEGDYVCIEPWLGIADSEFTNQDFKTKEGILSLEPNKSFLASYSIEIHQSHLV